MDNEILKKILSELKEIKEDLNIVKEKQVDIEEEQRNQHSRMNKQEILIEMLSSRSLLHEAKIKEFQGEDLL